MEIKLGYGKKKINIEINDSNILHILMPYSVITTRCGYDEVEYAINNPVESDLLERIICKNDTIAVITSDITRPVPNSIILPQILDRLRLAEVNEENITIVFALGSHRQHTRDEMINLVGAEIYKKYRCVDSCSDGYVTLGTTSYGTPVDICRHVAKATRRICIGNIEYHYFAGYSGGAKAIMPGVSTRAAIQSNHKRMVEATACAGNIKTNPVRLDIDEVLRRCPVDFIVNVILNEKKEVIKAVAGDCIAAHRAGCTFLDSVYKNFIRKKADIVLVSSGGWPKDINLYQAQKALDNAKHAVRDGGVIILLAACAEGFGEKVFESWLSAASCPEDMLSRIKQEFVLGGHKAAAISLVLEKAEIWLVSDLPDDLVRKAFMVPYDDVCDALNQAIEKYGADASIIVMPFGSSTLPCLIE